ncbi:MAG: phosphatase PAP2 family protein [Bacteroidales bacterium]|jgi:undecaprenyl-diphosphatase|nr:phosphatase PAP2 family protein [Bacteroidales bacterium]
MLDYLIGLDTRLFYAINSARCNFADWFFAVFSAHLFIGIVVTALSIYLMLTYFKQKWWVVLCLVGLSFLLADRLSVLCFKDVFERLRPSHALDNVFLCKMSHFHLLYNDKGGLYGFVSSHAANVFGISTLFSFFIRNRYVKMTMFLWAIVVCYSRIYCGYHYPADVICGSLLGILTGWGIYLLFRKSGIMKR